MISFEGLTLVTGRHTEAADPAHLCPIRPRRPATNMFPEGGQEGLYHTADATLWFFHAIDRYLEVTQDRATLTLILPETAGDIVEHHLRGTHFGIHVDPHDGLLQQGQEGYQLTWMDAKVGDWVVTPRHGKAVEINALWYNALCLLAGWVREEQGDEAARHLAKHAEQARTSFNARFWYAEGGYLYDVIDGPQGEDAACRPNQVFALSLRYPILDQARWERILAVVRQHLLTPVGCARLLQAIQITSPSTTATCARDAAYHQGTVWPWLIGPFIDAWLRVYPEDRAGARNLLKGLVPQLDEAGLGTICEIFDAEEPFTPRGCIAQAWRWRKCSDAG